MSDQEMSIRPGDASHNGRDYGAKATGFKITGRDTVRNFNKLVKVVAGGTGVNSTQQDYSLKAVQAGWRDDRINGLGLVCDDLNGLALRRNDSLLNSILKQHGASFDYGASDKETLNFRAWNEEVKTDLDAQAALAGLPAYIYVQLRFIESVLGEIDQARLAHHATWDIGEAESPLRLALEKFGRWLDFRLSHYESLMDRYGDGSATSRG